MPMLVLSRHGQSQWNHENRRLADVDLSPQGEAEARRVGELIRQPGPRL
jgi:2,3-bisphosphoglycerate-dependent phosphoglycerate mutase